MRNPKASDISDFAMYAALMQTNRSPHKDTLFAGTGVKGGWSTIWDIEQLLPEFPPKVIRAKLMSMDKRKITHGCYCGCRGDIRIVGPLPSLYA